MARKKTLGAKVPTETQPETQPETSPKKVGVFVGTSLAREYNKEDHGKDFKSLAEQYAKKVGGIVK